MNSVTLTFVGLPGHAAKRTVPREPGMGIEILGFGEACNFTAYAQVGSFDSDYSQSNLTVLFPSRVFSVCLALPVSGSQGIVAVLVFGVSPLKFLLILVLIPGLAMLIVIFGSPKA